MIEVQREHGVETLSFEEFERQVRRGDIPSETLVRMEVLTGKDFKPVGELELYQTLADPEDLAYERRLRNDPPIVTALLVGVQLRIYLWSKAPGAGDWLLAMPRSKAASIPDDAFLCQLRARLRCDLVPANARCA